MRNVHYDPSKITYPDGWKERAARALSEVEQAPENEKSDVVNRHRSLWAELKPELSKITHGKCWYTESLQVGTDTDVDHFRPKNSVKNAIKPGTQEEHPGYWWRAFDPTNYRFSCIVANRLRRDIVTNIVGGKADEFPLWKESERAWCPDDNCDNEQPLLIDPCIASDVALLSFASNGEAIARYNEDEKPKLYKKAEKSILLYHLNHSEFVKERTKLRDNIQELIEDAMRYYKRFGTINDNADNEHAYMRAIEKLRKACSEEEPFSSFAMSMLKPYRNEDYLEGVFG